MKKFSIVLLIAVLSMLVLSACGGGGAAADASKAVCTALGGLKTATGELSKVTADTSVADLKAAKVKVDDGVKLVKTANGVLNLPQVTTLLANYDELSKTVDGLASDATLGPAVDQVQAALAKITPALDQATATAKCQ